MNLIQHSAQRTRRTRTASCLASCRKLLAQLGRVKSALCGEFRQAVRSHEHLLELALNEAEALAWQTEYPHLIFPTLAAEKARAVALWHARQERLQHTRAPVAVAA